jgi:hypothetical protein
VIAFFRAYESQQDDKLLRSFVARCKCGFDGGRSGVFVERKKIRSALTFSALVEPAHPVRHRVTKLRHREDAIVNPQFSCPWEFIAGEQ